MSAVGRRPDHRLRLRKLRGSTRIGFAGWYGEECRGRLKANGLPVDADALTAASGFHQIGASLMVDHRARRVLATVWDRDPRVIWFGVGGAIGLSMRAFVDLAAIERGMFEVRIQVHCGRSDGG